MRSTMALPLSALDLVPFCNGGSSASALRSASELARQLDGWGYERLWYAEHHNMPGVATSAPEILIAHVAPQTSRIRLGAGGVMLPNHAPLKVAETYRLLSALHPARIDLGIGRAPGTDGLTAIALRRSRGGNGVDDFPTQLAELRGFGERSLPANHPFASIVAIPDDAPLPPIWLLGSTDYSARLAARLGLGFAFAGHFSPESPEWPMQLYRQEFQAGALSAPHAILALGVFCADTDADAQRMASSLLLSFAQLRSGKPGRMPSPEQAAQHHFTAEEAAAVSFFRRTQIVGTPNVVRERIEALALATAADEIMLATHTYSAEARARSYQLVAQSFGKTGDL